MGLLVQISRAFGQLSRRRRWLPELLILSAFAAVVGLGMEYLPSQANRVPAFILTALGFFPLWLMRIYFEAKCWRGAQTEGRLDGFRPSVVLDAPVLYRLLWGAPMFTIAWLAAQGQDGDMTRSALAIGALYLGSCFLHYLIQWTTIWMKTGVSLKDFLINVVLGFLALLHPIVVIVWLGWLRTWSVNRLHTIRWIRD